ncbi:hypothetical protein QYE76_053396 [Lolium multiflorum]|uniref:Reverse transcriptase domain-containing protein n=1 Tax=Lolium multiflorum TaxID=4521 RepID=A0AAD8SWR7_LOLMU|nr:hypothetical protein QYE76_053396 [Lolium multiflorum]
MDKENANPIVEVGSKRDASIFGRPLYGRRRLRRRRCIGGCCRGAIPAGWEPYDPVPYVPPPNPYDTSLEDPWNEMSGSDVGSDEEEEDVKTRQVLRRLQVGQYISYFAKEVYRCPFCTRRLGATDFNCLVTHAENISTFPNVGTTVNVHSFRATGRSACTSTACSGWRSPPGACLRSSQGSQGEQEQQVEAEPDGVLRQMGFGGRCLWWLALLLYTATVRIVVNGVPGKSIKVARGLRQGDPTSPQLFVLAMEVVTLCIVKATEAGLFAPLVGCSAKQRVSIYVDDVAIFIKPQVQDTVVIRELLNIFGEASGLRINYNKTAVVLIRGEGLDSMTVKHMLRCEIGAFPRKYLGLQLTTGHLRKVHWQPILDRILAALPAWQRGLIARSGRLILIKAVVSARPIHQLLALEAPVWLIEEIDRWTRAFFGRARRRLRVASVWSLGRRCASHFATVGLGSRTRGSKVWLYGSGGSV